MPRKYKRPLGIRQYASYCEENFKRCLEDIGTGAKSQTVAAKHYHIPRSTIKNKLRGDFNRKPRCPTVYSFVEENATVEHVNCREFGFPMTEQDLRFIKFTFSYMVSEVHAILLFSPIVSINKCKL
jgi:hypothetical protein